MDKKFLTLQFVVLMTFNLLQLTISQGEECITPDNRYGVCLLLPNCPSLIQVYSQNRRNPNIANYLRQSQRNCGNRVYFRNPIVCCFDADVQTEPPTPPPTPPPTRPTPPPTQPTPPPTPPPTQPPTPPPTQTNQQICSDPNGAAGHCENIKSCPAILNEFLAKRSDPQYIAYIQSSNANCNYVQPFICCPNAAPFPTLPTTPPTQPPTVGPSQPITANRLLTPEEGCGLSTKEVHRVVGGVPAQLGGWPWMALLGYTSNLGEVSFKCGGSIITKRHILTAAHCMKSTLSTVRVGEYDLSTDTETKHYDLPVVKTETYPDYDKKDGHNDLAIVYVGQDIPFTDLIKPVCLPIEPTFRSTNFEGYTPFVTGWGRTQEGGKSANVLQELQLPVLTNGECKDRYSAIGKLISEKQFDDAVICAGYLEGGKDSCQGDSGGPLMVPQYINEKFIFFQIGIVSYGIGCARTNVPGVYSRVPKFIDWIEAKVAEPV